MHVMAKSGPARMSQSSLASGMASDRRSIPAPPIAGTSRPPRMFRRDEHHYLINDSGLEGVESQIRSAFQKETLNLALVCSSRGSARSRPRISSHPGSLRDPPAAIENDAKQFASAGKSGAIGQLRLVLEELFRCR